MQSRFLGQILPDMDVCDIHGEKLGTVARVYRYDVALVGGDSTGQPLPQEEVVEVKTGFFGLGKHLYIPLSAVQDVTQGCAFVAYAKDDAESLGWHEKPAYLDDLT
jgi:hypothetical protein